MNLAIETKKVIFIIGVEGSGTTMLSRIVGRVENTEVVMGNGTTLENKSTHYQNQIKRLEKSSEQMWGKKADLETYNQSKLEFSNNFNDLVKTQEMKQVNYVFLKRSAPFNKENSHSPDLYDVLDIFPEAIIVFMVRDPKASTYSAVRRGFVKDVRISSLICDEYLTQLSSTITQIPSEKCILIDYQNFCEDPFGFAEKLSSVIGMPCESLKRAMQEEKISAIKNEQWKEKLNNNEIKYLKEYFSEKRTKKYANLFNNY